MLRNLAPSTESQLNVPMRLYEIGSRCFSKRQSVVSMIPLVRNLGKNWMSRVELTQRLRKRVLRETPLLLDLS
jgi:hypothetical protein